MNAVIRIALEKSRNGRGLSERLEKLPGVDMVAPFGASLHVSGRDAEALNRAIEPFRHDRRWRWTPDEATLEDVFIDLMAHAEDNF